MDEKKKEELFQTAWRQSDFYPWIMGILTEEIDSDYVRENIIQRAREGAPMDDTEIGQAMRAQVQAQLRIQSIKDKLE